MDLANGLGSLANLPKEILDRVEKLGATLFGPSLKEVGLALADEVRFRRIKNQVKILSKAEEFVRERNRPIKEIPLKVLVPLLDNASLEEEENIQLKWARLTANILTLENDALFEKTCISILGRLSAIEAIVFESTYLLAKRGIQQSGYWTERIQKKERKEPDVYIEGTVSLWNLNHKTKIDRRNIQAAIANLVSYGIIKWDVPEVEVTANKSKDETNHDIDVDVSVSDSDKLKLTELGLRFYLICNE